MIEALERAIVASVAPAQVREIGAWLVPLDDGVIGRARSAVPLTHTVDPATLDEVEATFAAALLPPAFRIADTEGLAAVRAELTRRGYVGETPTIMKLGAPAGLAGLDTCDAELLDAPDEDWTGTFAGPGFEPTEAAARLRNLVRAPGVRFAAVREAGRTLAVGAGTFNDGWLGVHGMRTAPDQRRRGYAARILATLGRAAQARGLERAVLQVTEQNPARRLYRAAGFVAVWRYRYWSRGPAR